MIVRVIVVDPKGITAGRDSDLLVFQVPENSREMELLMFMLDQCRFEHAVVSARLSVDTRRAAK